MSELLKRLANHIRNTPSAEFHVVAGRGFVGEDGPSIAPAIEPKVLPSKPVEPAGTVVDVGEGKAGRLAFFMDGVERSSTPCFFSMVPVVYGYTAVVIRARGADRRMATSRQFSGEALYLPYHLVDSGDLQRSGMATSDTSDGEVRTDEHPMMLLDAARKRISGDRDRLESEITSQWLAEFAGRDEWLLVDGSLTGRYADHESPNIVGVVKSHQTQYFPWEEQRKVLALNAGERTGVFIPGGRKRAEVYSWYLRLHPNQGRDLYFGLIRVEAAKCDRTLDMADEISRWLLAERCPLSLPDSRWDRMIYPIYDCEQYLKSRAPTRIVMDACMMGLGA